jgi:hypothetical protein
MLAASQLLATAVTAVLDSEAALVNTAAVAGLASALTSWAKRTVQFIQAAVQTAQQQASAASLQAEAASCFPAVVPKLLKVLLQPSAIAMKDCMMRLEMKAAGRSLEDASHNNNSNNSSMRDIMQGKASISLLVVVLARSLVQLSDAMEAAGPQQLFNALCCSPCFNVGWQRDPEWGPLRKTSSYPIWGMIMAPAGNPHQRTAECQWQRWQLLLLESCQELQGCFATVGLAPTGALDPVVAAVLGDSSSAAAAAAAAVQTDAIDSGCASTADAAQDVTWGYLLRLQQTSSRWAAAAAAFDAKWPMFCARELPSWGSVTAAEAVELEQQLAECLTLSTALTAAAPLPVTCTNPGCANLAGVSEAAASSKKCKECRCRYCSAACQAADWKQHKYACRSLKAAGNICM